MIHGGDVISEQINPAAGKNSQLSPIKHDQARPKANDRRHDGPLTQQTGIVVVKQQSQWPSDGKKECSEGCITDITTASCQSTASQITAEPARQRCSESGLGCSGSGGESKTSKNYKKTTEVLSARPLVREDVSPPSARIKDSNQRQKFPRVMQREKRQNKYVPKRNQPAYNADSYSEHPPQMQYQPLRRQQPQHHKQHQPFIYGGGESPEVWFQDANQGQRQPRRKRAPYNEPESGPQLKKSAEQNFYGFPLTSNMVATHSSLSQVKVYSDGNSSRFQNHPVHSFKAGSGPQVQYSLQVSHGAKYANNETLKYNERQQLESQSQNQASWPVPRQDQTQTFGKGSSLGFDSNNQFMSTASFKNDQQLAMQQTTPSSHRTSTNPTHNLVVCPRSNAESAQGTPVDASNPQTFNYRVANVSFVPSIPEQGSSFGLSSSNPGFPSLQDMNFNPGSAGATNTPHFFQPTRQFAHGIQRPTFSFNGACVGHSGYSMPHAAPLWNQNCVQGTRPGFEPNTSPWQQSQPMLQVVNNPLRVKTGVAGPAPNPQCQQSCLSESRAVQSSLGGESSSFLVVNATKVKIANEKTPISSDTMKNESGAGESQQFRVSTEAVDESKEHIETFDCLTKCTEWYLLAQVGNSQIKIPAKHVAVRFSDNAQELPILTKDLDLFENLVRKEEYLSSSPTPITQLNRPVNAGNNPSSSNNTSNNGYRKKDNVIIAQREYDKKLRLNLVGDNDTEKQKQFRLTLPINNSSHDANTRLVDLYLHHRTQQLMCLEFDLTHLKLDDAESSFSGEYSDNFSCNQGGECDPSQPVPFLGQTKSQTVSTYGQPQRVLYISECNTVARQLRYINQDFVDRTTYFKLNGECHGKQVFEQDLKYQVQGKKVIKSIQERLIRAKDYIFNEIVRIEPTVTKRHPSESSSSKEGSSSREAIPGQGDQNKNERQQRTLQRSQKSVLSSLRRRNKRCKGPYLLRSDVMHIPIVNVTKSLGFKMLMPNLASIDNMLTNFNQIVMQEGVIQSLFFSFDLPVHQLSTRSPAVSNHLVVKIPKDFAGGGIQSSYHQAAYLAYQQHRASMTHGQDPYMQQQPFYGPLQAQPVAQVQEILQKGASNQIVGDKQPLWNLLDEFKRISQGGANQSSHCLKNEQGCTSDQKNGPFPYRVTVEPQTSPFSQHFASSSANSNGSSSLHKPPFLSQISSLLSQGDNQQSQKPFGMPSCDVSSQNSNLSHRQTNVGMLAQGSPQPIVPGSGPDLAQPRRSGQLQQNVKSPSDHQLPVLTQNLHHALYSLRTHFSPCAFGFGSCDPGCGNPFSQQFEAPIYSPPEDPNYFSNLDRLLEAITPRVSLKQLDVTSVTDFFKSFKRSSVFGLRVELLNEMTLEAELFTFTPTLSSLVLSYTKPLLDSLGDRVNRVLDFSKVDDTTKTQVVEAQADKAPSEVFVGRAESAAQSSSQQPLKSRLKFIEVHESEPHYLRPAFFSKVKEVVAELPHLKDVLLKTDCFNFDSSWFSVLWTCQRVCTVPSSGISHAQNSVCGDENATMSSAFVSCIQFLAIFRFRPKPFTQPARDGSQGAKVRSRRQPVELVGLMPYKCDRESFWVSPSHLQTENNLQGEMYDQISEENTILLQDLKQRAIEFLQLQERREEIHDFTYLLNSTNSTIFDFF